MWWHAWQKKWAQAKSNVKSNETVRQTPRRLFPDPCSSQWICEIWWRARDALCWLLQHVGPCMKHGRMVTWRSVLVYSSTRLSLPDRVFYSHCKSANLSVCLLNLNMCLIVKSFSQFYNLCVINSLLTWVYASIGGSAEKAESYIHDKQCGFILALSIAPILFVFEDVWLCAVRVALGVQWPVVTGHSCSGIRAGRSGALSVNGEQKAHQRPERFAVSLFLYHFMSVPVVQTFLRHPHGEAGTYLSHLRGRGRPRRGRQIWQGIYLERTQANMERTCKLQTL